MSVTARPHVNIVGSGPNGLTAATLLARAGWHVRIYERNANVGGAAASADVFGDGSIVDLGAAAHPFGVASPIFRHLGLEDYGLEWLHSEYPMAHPFDDAPAAILHRDVRKTARALGVDSTAWRLIHRGIVNSIDDYLEQILRPILRFPDHPVKMAQFGLLSTPPSTWFVRTAFRDEPARALFTGSAAHANTPLGHPFTSTFGVLFSALGMTRGWPVVKGGTGALVDALVQVITEYGGEIHTNAEVTDLDDLPSARATMLDVTPSQALVMRGKQLRDLPETTVHRLQRWRYGPGVYKVDWLLDGPVDWADDRVANATTVHLGGRAAEIRLAEAQVNAGRIPDRPFVMVTQPQVADPSRAPEGKHVLWTYTHVPHGYRPAASDREYVADAIAGQLERFAPGFGARVLDKKIWDPGDLENWNPNLVGGDIAGGSMGGLQSMLRGGLTLEPYRMGVPGLYICSSATPPGAGVHGMPGAWAAHAVLQDQRV
ncbi:MAG: NAD(P)/FAD-dependent oxidoreductase [Micrococcaceae bacterium]|nr:NAD(P)/FAD-dependent oxidoreductase [Micrococcaceae bacterium]